MLSYSLITEQQRLMGEWMGGGECDLRASRSGTDRDGFTVAQAWNCFSFPLELSWKCLRLQTISKQELSQSPRARTMKAQRQVRKTLNYLEPENGQSQLECPETVASTQSCNNKILYVFHLTTLSEKCAFVHTVRVCAFKVQTMCTKPFLLLIWEEQSSCVHCCRAAQLIRQVLQSPRIQIGRHGSISLSQFDTTEKVFCSIYTLTWEEFRAEFGQVS